MDTVRWGVLGTARIGAEQVIPAIRRARHAELVGVASRDGRRAQAFTETNNIPKSYPSYEALLADPEIDAVYIPLPNHLHAQWTIRAAESGKHVLCEKPAVLNEAEWDAVEQACTAHGVLFMEAFMYQFHPQWQQVWAHLKAGDLGQLVMVNANFRFALTRPDDIRLQPEAGGGALYDVGCYCVHAIRRLVGAAPTDIQAMARFAEDEQVDRSLSANLRFQNGVMAHFDCSFEAQSQQTVEIVGSAGTLRITHAFRPDQGQPQLRIQRGQSHLVVEDAPVGDMYALQVEHFGAAIRQGTPLLNTMEDTRQNMAWLDAIYRATGRAVR